MSNSLNTGTGVCRATQRLHVSITVPVLHLGSGPDVFKKLCATVHHWNRHAEEGAFIAIAFPRLVPDNMLTMGDVDVMAYGADLDLFGSKEAISAFTEMPEMTRLVSRGMVTMTSQEIAADTCTGVAFIRDRRSEKLAPGWARRAARRDEKRGFTSALTPEKTRAAVAQESHIGRMSSSKGFPINFLPRKGEALGEIRVTTYGLSASNEPGYLSCTPLNELRDLSGLDMSFGMRGN